MESWDMALDSLPDVPDDPGFDTFFWHIYRRSKFTDVQFELETPNGSVPLSAHRMVVSMWSPIFADMFYGTGKQNNLVCLSKVNPEAFEDMLKFMYGREPLLGSHRKVCELNKVAAEFGVTGLVNLCQNFLSSVDIEISNVFDIIELANSSQNRRLMDRCMKLIERETRNIISHYECSEISPSVIRIILNSPKLALSSEYELLTWLFAWAKNRYLEQSVFSDIREVLDEFLPQLHFLDLTNTQFATIYKNHKNIFSQDEALRIFMNIAVRDSWLMPSWHNADAEFRVYTAE